MPEMREGAQAVSPPFISGVSKAITAQAHIEAIIGKAAYADAWANARYTIYGDAVVTQLYPVLTFNAGERAILVFYDEINQPADAVDWAPRQWRKKFSDDGGAMYQKAVAMKLIEA